MGSLQSREDHSGGFTPHTLALLSGERRLGFCISAGLHDSQGIHYEGEGLALCQADDKRHIHEFVWG